MLPSGLTTSSVVEFEPADGQLSRRTATGHGQAAADETPASLAASVRAKGAVAAEHDIFGAIAAVAPPADQPLGQDWTRGRLRDRA